MKKYFLIILLLNLISCSTLIKGDKQNLRVISESNKKISIYDKYGNLILENNGLIEIELKKNTQVFKPQKYFIKTDEEEISTDIEVSINTFILGNMFIPFGHLIDALNGSMYNIIIQDKIVDTIYLK